MGLLGLGRSGAQRRLLARFGRNGVRGQGSSRGLRPFLSSRWHQPGLAAVFQPIALAPNEACVAEILLEGGAIRPRPWIESPSQRDPGIAQIV
jgi:hypothetical protein